MLHTQVAAGDLWKEKGNKAYRESKIDRAVRLYDKVCFVGQADGSHIESRIHLHFYDYGLSALCARTLPHPRVHLWVGACAHAYFCVSY